MEPDRLEPRVALGRDAPLLGDLPLEPVGLRAVRRQRRDRRSPTAAPPSRAGIPLLRRAPARPAAGCRRPTGRPARRGEAAARRPRSSTIAARRSSEAERRHLGEGSAAPPVVERRPGSQAPRPASHEPAAPLPEARPDRAESTAPAAAPAPAAPGRRQNGRPGPRAGRPPRPRARLALRHAPRWPAHADEDDAQQRQVGDRHPPAAGVQRALAGS